MPGLRLNLIVAACNSNGIGKNGQLPWRLKKDMEFFKQITTQTKQSNRKNAVIMGRKTWFSIPEKFRPLKDRINIVLSRELKEVPDGVYIARSLPEALDLLAGENLRDLIENIYIIGGSSVYQEAMETCDCRINLTRILADFDCDTHLPEIKETVFRKIENPENVPTELQEEKDIKFRFEVYDKIDSENRLRGDCESRLREDREHVPIRFYIMAAMCHHNRGIAKDLQLPWPSLSRDYEYYISMVSTLKSSMKSGKILHIRGRHTWECCGEEERTLPNVYHIVVSGSLSNDSHPRLLKIVPGFNEAMLTCATKPLCDTIDSIWVMGGANIFKAALQHPCCDRLYLTHIYRDYTADTFFPEFEQNFSEIRQDGVTPIEENGIQYEFKVYQRISEHMSGDM